MSTIEGVESNVMMGIIGGIVSIVVAFVMTLVIGFDKEVESTDEESNNVSSGTSSQSGSREELVSPVTGEVVPLSEVKDEVFSSGALGKVSLLIQLSVSYMHQQQEKLPLYFQQGMQ